MTGEKSSASICMLLESLDELPPEWEPLELIAIVKSRSPDGDLLWSFRLSETLSIVEALGQLIIQADLIRADMIKAYEDE
jgi:hypothetical protein